MDSITHGDADGIISAAVLLNNNLANKVIFTTPGKIHGIKTDNCIITDIAYNSDNAKQIEWMEKNKEKINKYYDHHEQSNILYDTLKDKLTLNSNALSCVQVLADNGLNMNNEWLDAANSLDTIGQPLNKLGDRINAALKSTCILHRIKRFLIIEQIQHMLLWELFHTKTLFIDKYVQIYKNYVYINTLNKMSDIKNIKDIGFVNITKADIDKHLLFNNALQIYSFLGIQQLTPIQEQVTTIGSKMKLKDLFPNSKGNDHRVTIHYPVGWKKQEEFIVLRIRGY